MRENKYLYLAIILAVITGVLFFQFLKGQTKRDYVVVAREGISRYSCLDSSMLELKAVHPDSVQPGSLDSLQDAVGRFAVVDLIQGEHILLTKVSGHSAFKDFTGELEPVERGIFIPLSLKQNLGGAISRDDIIDIIYVAFDNQRGFSVSKTILQRVRVLDVRTDSGQPIHNDEKGIFGGIIVALSPHDAEKIVYCLENGQLYITRQPYDGKVISTEGVFYENIFRED